MTASDFGSRPRKGPPWIWIGLVLLVLALAAIFGASWWRHRGMAIAEAEEWNITGPPCPALSRAAFLKAGFQAPQAVDFDDVRFARRFGHTSCNEIAYDGGRGFSTFPICEFTGPAVLVITTDKGETYFAPGIGHPATVSVQHGQPTCVMNSKFR